MHVPMPSAPAVGGGESDDPFADALSQFADAEQNGSTQAAAVAGGGGGHCPSCAQPMEAGAVLCVGCGYNTATGQRMGMRVEQANIPIAHKSGNAGMLAYQRSAPAGRGSARGSGSRGDNNIGQPFQDLYLPIGLFLVGVLLTFLEARFALHIRDISFALGYTGVMTMINLVLVFIGIMIATKLMDLGLGPVGPALLKIAAIAVLPGAVANLIGAAIPAGGSYIGWFISLLIIYGMFMGLLDLDFQETMICTAIIWIVRTWAGYALVMLILGGFGLMLPGSGGGGSSSSVPSAPKVRSVTVKELDAVAAKALASGTAKEAKAWAAATTDQQPREIPNGYNASAGDFAQALYDLGAKAVTVTREKKAKDSTTLEARQLVIELPPGKAARRKVFRAMWETADQLDVEFFKDRGQKYIVLDYDVSGAAEPPLGMEE
jgi:hypothetical protein